MSELKYPVGIQTFSKIIEEGFAYVDKTAYIKPLLSQGQFIFLSRPRRFGKSLLLSTLKAYFEGRRELFKGLAADTMDLDWTPSPVLRFDFNAENFSMENGLELHLDTLLRSHEKVYGRHPEDISPSQRFRALIETAYEQTGRKVVILIDEYDKPLLDIVPYDDHNEPTYRAITFLISVLSGSPTLAEHHGYRGRSDLEVFAPGYIYIFEFKYNKSVREAMTQIHARDYAGRYALDPRNVYLIAANFIEDSENRGLEYEIESLHTIR